MAKFAFSALFSAVGVAAAFDDATTHDAQHGRVNRQFAALAAAEYGLPLLKNDGNPVAKAQFLKIANDYRAAKGKGMVKGHNKQAQWGAAFDAISLGLMLGGEDAQTPERVQALKDSGQYLGDALAWAEACKPAAKPQKAPKEPAPAPKAGEPSPVPTVAHAPIVAEAQQSGPVAVTEPEASTEASTEASAEAGAVADAITAALADSEAAPESVTMDLGIAFDAVILGLQTGAFSAAEVQALQMAVLVAIKAQEAAPATV